MQPECLFQNHRIKKLDLSLLAQKIEKLEVAMKKLGVRISRLEQKQFILDVGISLSLYLSIYLY